MPVDIHARAACREYRGCRPGRALSRHDAMMGASFRVPRSFDMLLFKPIGRTTRHTYLHAASWPAAQRRPTRFRLLSALLTKARFVWSAHSSRFHEFSRLIQSFFTRRPQSSASAEHDGRKAGARQCRLFFGAGAMRYTDGTCALCHHSGVIGPRQRATVFFFATISSALRPPTTTNYHFHDASPRPAPAARRACSTSFFRHRR